MIMVLFNYSIWYYLLFIYFLVVGQSVNAFWQILVATIIGEFIEKFGKKHQLWPRPLYARRDQPPPGLVERWYNTGSFPSGHTIKAVYFWLFALQYQAINPVVNLLVLAPLCLFRVLVGFHYPIDIIGGFVFGLIIWFASYQLQFPPILNQYLAILFNFVFAK